VFQPVVNPSGIQVSPCIGCAIHLHILGLLRMIYFRQNSFLATWSFSAPLRLLTYRSSFYVFMAHGLSMLHIRV
jgi:hypothetical protein